MIKNHIDGSYYSFHTSDFSGALVLLQGEGTEEDRKLAARISGRYSKGRTEKVLKVKFGKYGSKFNSEIEVEPISDEELQEYIVSVK